MRWVRVSLFLICVINDKIWKELDGSGRLLGGGGLGLGSEASQ